MINAKPLSSKTKLIAVSVSALLAGCSSYGTKPDLNACVGEAHYKVVFQGKWNKDSHPNSVPDKPHFSHVFGITHNNEISVWQPGAKASKGIKAIAERGSGYQFIKDALWQIKIDNAGNVFDGNHVMRVNSSSIAEFVLDDEFSRVSLVNMIAPSPDWITGVSSLNLCENGQWLESKTITAEVYDAGTDNGNTFTADDDPTLGEQAIVKLEGSGRSQYKTFPPVGEYQFTKIAQVENPSGSGYVRDIRAHFDEIAERRADN